MSLRQASGSPRRGGGERQAARTRLPRGGRPGRIPHRLGELVDTGIHRDACGARTRVGQERRSPAHPVRGDHPGDRHPRSSGHGLDLRLRGSRPSRLRPACDPRLVQAAARADLVVVGRHLRRSPLGVHLGSVAHAVLHHSAAPVAVIAHD
ncbi:universal stress protein [Streptomyces sp. AB3(2024)]|uniref:universal stress protein n=1 Tax=Streptomyces sp. AB3(2024) TaxID=3317321 RepID=UPI0035A3672A